MSKILDKHIIAPKTNLFVVFSPRISRHAQPGQFVIVRASANGERIPLTIADFDPCAGTITLVVQEVGKSSQEIGRLKKGQAFHDLLGPLGTPSDIEFFGEVVLVGGGFGIAAIYPIAKALKAKRNILYTIIGARSYDLLIMEAQMRQISDYLTVMTDDGSAGRKGIVTKPLEELLIEHKAIDRVLAIGPLPMMRAVSEVTKSYYVKTMVSLNPIMVDGTGMCGGCRVHVGSETKFACTDGPEFDAHLVDFDEIGKRLRMYKSQEERAKEICQAKVQNSISTPNRLDTLTHG